MVRMRVSGDLTLLSVALFVSAGANLYFGVRVFGTNSPAPPGDGLKPGEVVEQLVAKRLDGQTERVRLQDRKRGLVVYAFTTTCGWCFRNTANVRALAASVAPTYDFMGIALDEFQVSEYVQQRGLTFPVYTNPSKEICDHRFSSVSPGAARRRFMRN